MKYQMMSLMILIVFYAVYLGKMIIQKKQGITTNQIAKDKKNKHRYHIEIIMKIATYSIICIEVISILLGTTLFSPIIRNIGILLGVLGDAIFLSAVVTMGSSWRAGIAAQDHRQLITKGIFHISRNPAFLGFDLMYISILIMFFNPILLFWTLLTIIMLHLQILQEEKYLIQEFGEDYLKYKQNVYRYLGVKIR